MKITSLIARAVLILLTVTAPVAAPAQSATPQSATPESASAQPALQQRVEQALAQAPQGTRFGLVVTDEAGRELVAINPNGRFVPASNTKLLTTAAAYATLTGLDQPDAAGGAAVALVPSGHGAPDLILIGHGDARLSSAADCVNNCLAALADAVAARTRQVNNVVADASLFSDDRWSPGMSWNNIHTRSGTGVAALSLDDNEWSLRVTPGEVGQAPNVESPGYLRIVNRATTVAAGENDLDFHRLPGDDRIVLTGSIAANSPAATLRQGIDDPAHYAAWRMVALLEARGVSVAGRMADYRQPTSPAGRDLSALEPVARLTPPPLSEDIVRINKDSQNLHAELLLRRIGLARGDGSIEGGVAGVAAMMAQAGVPRTGWDISDGSGMSNYNRITPRAMIGLLNWAARQPWGQAWHQSLAVAGVDGTLRNRFRGTPLEGRLFAKTGTINAANGLSGYLIAASGRRLSFAFFANDMPGGASATARMDAVLLEIAAAN